MIIRMLGRVAFSSAAEEDAVEKTRLVTTAKTPALAARANR
jgi:hypothetical protein